MSRRLSPPPGRPGKILVQVALLLTVLLGMVGLVIDTGLAMAAHRQAQNAADSAALVAAVHLFRGDSNSTAIAAANSFVQTHNNLSTAAVTVNLPPATGPYAGNPKYAEVIVDYTVDTWFVRILNINQTPVRARAVAGYEALASGEGAIVLDPRARPGLSIQGGATLRVDGAVVVNSEAAGLDQYGQPVDWGLQSYALTSSPNSTVEARYIQVRGGVDTVANYRNFEPGGPNPLFCRSGISPDPLRDLPAPTDTNVNNMPSWTRIPPITVSSGETRTFTPGVYEDIVILQGATATFQPGVYVLSPTGNNQGFRANGGCTITGNGVMFYCTGDNYLDQSPGYWDTLDDSTNSRLDGPLPPTSGSYTLPAPPDGSQVRFATVDINATDAQVELTGLSDATSPFNGVLFFQRRRNTNDVAIQGNAGVNVRLGGTMYAKWARFKLAGEGRYDAQFVVGSMAISGQAVVTILAGGKSFGRANQVFLVE